MDMRELADFVIYLTKEIQEEKREEYLFQTWLHKVWDKIEYADWKKTVIKANKKQVENKTKMTKEEEKENISKAEHILGRK